MNWWYPTACTYESQHLRLTLPLLSYISKLRLTPSSASLPLPPYSLFHLTPSSTSLPLPPYSPFLYTHAPDIWPCVFLRVLLDYLLGKQRITWLVISSTCRGILDKTAKRWGYVHAASHPPAVCLWGRLKVFPCLNGPLTWQFVPSSALVAVFGKQRTRSVGVRLNI